MIKVRPHQDDAAFPPFCYDDIAPDSILWFDDLFDEDAQPPAIKRRRPVAKVGHESKRRRKSKTTARLSEASRDLLLRATPNSPLAQQLLMPHWATSTSPLNVEPLSLVSVEIAADVKCEPAPTAASNRPDRKPLQKVSPKAIAPKTKNEKASVAIAPALNRIRPKSIKASPETPSKSTAEVPAPAETPILQSRFARLTPRTDKFGKKRRQKLTRIRREICARSVVRDEPPVLGSGNAADIPVRAPRAKHKQKGQRKQSANTVRPSRIAPVASKASLRTKRKRKRTSASASVSDAPFLSIVSVAEPQSDTRLPIIGNLNDEKDESDSDVAGSYRVIPPPPPVEESYSDWFKRVVVRHRCVTWFTTFYLHWILLLLMAAVIVHNPELTSNLILSATVADQEPPDLPPLEITPAELEPEPVETEDEVPVLEESVVAELAEKDVAISESLLNSMTEETPQATNPSEKRNDRNNKQNEPESKTAPRPNPAPTEAVSAGSFSVWTEPSQPAAGEPYRIIIQIRLPEGVDRYDVADLQGLVVGSDGYRKPIPGSTSGELLINDSYARFIVPIVSADAEVRDTIFIKSRMLKETQKIVLEF